MQHHVLVSYILLFFLFSYANEAINIPGVALNVSILGGRKIVSKLSGTYLDILISFNPLIPNFPSMSPKPLLPLLTLHPLPLGH